MYTKAWKHGLNTAKHLGLFCVSHTIHFQFTKSRETEENRFLKSQLVNGQTAAGADKRGQIQLQFNSWFKDKTNIKQKTSWLFLPYFL